MDDPDSGFTADEWEEIKDLVADCQQQEPRDLSDWLAGRGSSERVRAEVERLIRSASTCGNFLERPASEEYLGLERGIPQRIGRYRVLEQLGSGGIGVVYAATDEELKRRVAIKVLHAHTAADPELRKRLRWDAQAASALQHPNIVVVYEVGTDEGADYVAMECINGKTLGNLIPAQGMEPDEALRCAIQIASGLEAAHNAGIVHRDLKPGNIMVNESGVVKLLDFGLAKFHRALSENSVAPLTIEGKFAGTVAYVSPEQAEGKTVDARSDIFAFGIVLYEMLTGTRAFGGDSTISVLADILHTDPLSPSQIRPELDRRFDEIVKRCLKKSRDRRFQTVSEVRVRLQEIEEERAQTEHGRTAIHTRVVRRGNGWLWALCAVLALAATGLGWELWRVRQQLVREPEPSLFNRSANMGLNGSPAISKSGISLAYASDRFGKGHTEILVQHTDATDAITLTDDPFNHSDPAFTPTGESVVYRSEKDGGGLFVTPTTKPRERSLAPLGRGPQVSADGATVLFWKGEIGGALYPGTVEVRSVPFDGGPSKRLFPQFTAAAYPLWSPKGDRILFLGRMEGSSQIDWWVSDRGGAHPHATGLLAKFNRASLYPPFGSYFIQPTAWVPRRNLLLFSARLLDSSNIWSITVTDDGIPIDEPHRLTFGTSIESGPSATVTSTSLRVAYSAQSATASIWRLALDSQGRAAGHPQPLVTDFPNASSPSISADGTKLGFQLLQNNTRAVNLLDLKTVTQTFFKQIQFSGARPILSGNGAYLVYGFDRKGYRIRVATSEVEEICDRCASPTWVSFDGSEVLFESPGDPEEIQIWRGPGPLHPVVRITGDIPRQYAGRLSPDGRWMVFSGANRVGERRIYLAPVRDPGGVAPAEVVALTDGPSDHEPTWSPDGQIVYYLSNKDNSRCIWGLRLDSKPPRSHIEPFEVAHFHNASLSIRALSSSSGDIGLSVSRSSLVFTVTQSSGNIWEAKLALAPAYSK